MELGMYFIHLTDVSYWNFTWESLSNLDGDEVIQAPYLFFKNERHKAGYLIAWVQTNSLSSNNQYQGYREQRALFEVFITAVQETRFGQTWKSITGEKESGACTGDSYKDAHEFWLTLIKERK